MDFTRKNHPLYLPSEHHFLITKTLEKITNGLIDRLMIVMPPRHGKSELVSIHFPAWILGHFPDTRIIHASYSSSLSRRFSRASRNIVNSKLFQEIFNHVKIAKDSKSVESWDIENTRGGLISVGVGGSITGFGADIAIIDDPVKGAAEANSETYRQNIKDWYCHDLRTRLEKNGKIIICQTRWHEDDLVGWLLKQEKIGGEKWHLLHLPALDSQNNPLWKEKFSLEELYKIKSSIGTYAWESLYQGNPIPFGGGLIRKDWFKIRSEQEIPDFLYKVIGVDLAVSVKTNADFTVGTPIGFTESGEYWVLPPLRGRFEWPDTRKLIVEHAIKNSVDRIGIEKVAFQAAAIQDLQRNPQLAGIPLIGISAHKDKITRASEWLPFCEMGKIHLVDDGSGWHEELLKECEAFPKGKHDDMIDSLGIAISTLKTFQKDLRFE